MSTSQRKRRLPKPALPTQVTNVVPTGFVCKYCHKHFVREYAYLEHKCTQMKRIEELATPLGQTALTYYQYWFKVMKKIPPVPEVFLTSAYYRTFNNFALFVRKVNLPNPNNFISLMVLKNFQPTMWTLDATYALYMDYLEHHTTPMEQVRLSIATLLTYSESHDIDIEDIFDKLHPSELIAMIRERRVSPWLLLNSKKFKHFFINVASKEQQMIIESLIRLESWAKRLTDNPDLTQKIKHYVQEINI